MGIQKNGIFGAWSGKVGGLVGSSIYGKPTIRTYQPTVLNRKSTGQIAQRTAFKACNQLGISINSGLLIPLMKRFVTGMSQLNKFTALNVGAFSSTGVLHANNLIISFGKLTAPVIQEVSWSADELSFRLNTVVDDYQLPTDKVYMLIVNNEPTSDDYLRVIYSGFTGVTRAVNTGVVDCEVRVGDKLAVVFSYLRADGSLVSDSSVTTIN